MKGLYKGGGKANQLSVNAGTAGVVLGVTPGGQTAAALMGQLAVVSGIVGLSSEAVAGLYYAYHGNYAPLGKTGIGWAVSKMNPFGKTGQPAWDRVVNLGDAKNTGNPQCSPD